MLAQSYANNFSSEVSLKELRKQDLFDLGVMLILAAMGGLEMIDEEFLSRIPNIQSTCCLICAVKAYSKSNSGPQVLTLLKIFGRLTDSCQDFICLCMQQRFSKNEMKRFQITQVCTAADLKGHSWLHEPMSARENRKRSQITLSVDSKLDVMLTLKELLNVSSDWMDVKNRGIGGQAHSQSGQVPSDFQ